MVALFFRKLRRDVGRQRGQFAAVIVTIFLGITLFGASYDAYQNLRASYDKTFEKLSAADLTVSGGNSAAIVEAARQTTGVDKVATRTVAELPLQIGDANKLIGRVVGMPVDTPPAVNRVEMLSGDYLSSNRPDGVIVEQHMAEHFNLTVGQQLVISGSAGDQTVTVIGTAASTEYLWPVRNRQEIFPSPDEFGVLFIPEMLAQQLAGSQAVEEVLIRYQPSANSGQLDQHLRQAADSAGAVSTVTRDEQPSNVALSLDIDGFREMSWLFPLLFLVSAAGGAYVLANRIVHSQRSQIGMLMANGFSRRAMLLHYLSYGVFIGLVGAIPGALAGALLARSVTSLYLSELSIPVTASSVRPVSVLIGVGLGLLMGAVATFAPAWTAAGLSPVEAMRGIGSTGRAKQSFLERIMPPLQRLPARWKLVVRGIGRSKRRSLSTIVGVVLALTLILVSWTMIDTTNILLSRQFDQIERQDAKVYFSQPVSSGEIEALGGVQDVERVEPAIELATTIQFQSSQYPTTLIGLEPDTQLHEFRAENGDRLQLPPTGILAGKALRSQLGVGQGDQVMLLIPGQQEPLTMTIEGFVDEPLGTYVYASLPQLSGIAAQGQSADTVNAALVKFSPGANRDAVSAAIAALPAVAAVRDTQFLADTIRSFMSLFYAFVGVMLVFGGVMAFSLIFNTMSVNITERSVELATLEAAGMEERSIQKLVVAENMLLVLIAIAPGLLAGYLCARWFMGTFSTDLFQFDLQVYPPTFIFACAGHHPHRATLAMARSACRSPSGSSAGDARTAGVTSRLFAGTQSVAVTTSHESMRAG